MNVEELVTPFCDPRKKIINHLFINTKEKTIVLYTATNYVQTIN